MKRALLSVAAIAALAALAGCHTCGLGGGSGLGCGTCATAPETCQSCGVPSAACDTCAMGDPGHDCKHCARHVNKMACRKGRAAPCGHRAPMQLGPPMGSITYPYYTLKGPGDFLATDTRPIGP
jgi:hypothetical protein